MVDVVFGVKISLTFSNESTLRSHCGIFHSFDDKIHQNSRFAFVGDNIVFVNELFQLLIGGNFRDVWNCQCFILWNFSGTMKEKKSNFSEIISKSLPEIFFRFFFSELFFPKFFRIQPGIFFRNFPNFFFEFFPEFFLNFFFEFYFFK